MELQAPRKRQANMQTSETLGSLMFMHLDIGEKGSVPLNHLPCMVRPHGIYFIEQF